jgi:hypothetical protein
MRVGARAFALRPPTVGIFVFQGNNDSQTPVRYVRELEAWNNQLGHLHLTFRYYEGAHVGGPPEIKRELSDLLVRLTAPNPSVRGAPGQAGAELSGERCWTDHAASVGGGGREEEWEDRQPSRFTCSP